MVIIYVDSFVVMIMVDMDFVVLGFIVIDDDGFCSCIFIDCILVGFIEEVFVLDEGVVFVMLYDGGVVFVCLDVINMFDVISLDLEVDCVV